MNRCWYDAAAAAAADDVNSERTMMMGLYFKLGPSWLFMALRHVSIKGHDENIKSMKSPQRHG